MSSIQILKFTLMKKGYLEARIDILLPKIGMEIRDVTAWRKGDQRWFNMPSRKYEDDEGKVKYHAYVAFPTPDTHAAWQRALKASYDDYLNNHPGILNGM